MRAAWRAYAQRAVSYLQAAYPLRPDGLLPIVPGLGFDWSPSIMDGYAALNQYEGLTLWLLSDALAKWPQAGTSQASLPADNRELLVDDLASSGLVWGRAGSVWWQLAGRATSSDPRAAQGLVAVKLDDASGWHDLLALRPIHGKTSSTWTLTYANGTVATPTFTGVARHGPQSAAAWPLQNRDRSRARARRLDAEHHRDRGRAEHEHARQDDAAHHCLAYPGAPAPLAPRAPRSHTEPAP